MEVCETLAVSLVRLENTMTLGPLFADAASDLILSLGFMFVPNASYTYRSALQLDFIIFLVL
jgi:hypothetical protein